jgi:hypothetical protein
MEGSSRPQLRSSVAGLLTVLLLSSCSTIVGSVKPVDEKSEGYSAADLSKDAPQVWKKLDQSQLLPKDGDFEGNAEAFSSEMTDVAYQSRKTAAIISLNSSCRKNRGQVLDLHPVLRELLLGMSDVTERTETPTTVSGIPALGGTVAGTMGGEKTKIQAVVVSKDDCVYDLMYISRPERFQVHAPDFGRFVSSLRLR